MGGNTSNTEVNSNQPIKIHEDYFSRGDVRLFYRNWLPDRSDGRVLVVIHGLCEHIGRYQNLVDALPLFSIWALDLRGHGRSWGRRGDADFRELVDDVICFLDMVCNRTNHRPVLLGHSFGGLLALHVAAKGLKYICALVTSSAAFRLSALNLSLVREMIRSISTIFPSLTTNSRINPYHLSHDKDVAIAYANDPLVHRRVSWRLLRGILDAQEEACRVATSIDVPTLFLHAGDDKIAPSKGSEIVFKNIKSEHKQLIIYPGFYHEIFNEIDKSKPLGDLKRWLDKLKFKD